MIKILFFIPDLSGGGAEKVLRNLVNNMDQSRFDITVHTINACDSAKYLVEGIHYRAINRCRSRWGKKLMEYWFRLCTELKWTYPLYIKDDYDIEVAYLECGATKVMAASANAKALKLAWVHCDLQKKGVTGEKTKKQYEKFDKVICVSEDTLRAFAECFGESIDSVVLHNVIDEEEIFEKAKNALPEACRWKHSRILAVGRLSKEKAFDRLIEACACLKNSGYKFQLKILGEGPERAKLEGMIANYDLRDYVELCGFCDNPYPYMKAADMVVCSSEYEGLSTVVLESLLLGRPVITTPCGGMQELLGESQYGLIVDGNAKALAQGIQRLMDDPELAAQYADAASKRGQSFYKKAMVEKTEAFLIATAERRVYNNDKGFCNDSNG